MFRCCCDVGVVDGGAVIVVGFVDIGLVWLLILKFAVGMVDVMAVGLLCKAMVLQMWPV